MARKLYRMGLKSKKECFTNFKIDGIERRVSQSRNLWRVMCGNAPEGVTPTVTLEFDFVWENASKLNWATTVVQAYFRAHAVRKNLDKLVTASFATSM